MPWPQLSSPWVVRWIGALKLCKALMLLVVGTWVFHFLGQPDLQATINRWVHSTGIDPANRHVQEWIAKLLAVDPRKLKTIGVVTFIYAGLYGIEGVGLLMAKTWAEWMTVITTAGFIPLEIYELVHRPGPVRMLVLFLNLLVLAYLIRRLQLQHRVKKEAKEAGVL